MKKEKKNEPAWKDILKEIKIGKERIGFKEDSGKVAVLNPKELIEKTHQPEYDKKVHQLEEQGYKISYTSAETPKKLSRERVYDIFERL